MLDNNNHEQDPNKSIENEGISIKDSPFFNPLKNNQSLTTNTLSLGHLRIYLLMKYTSLRQAGQQAGLSYSRIKQLVTGKYLPSRPALIKQISEAWDIDPIKLTQLFERIGDLK